MNEDQFKHHLKELVHGHHRPEEHDWDSKPASAKKAATAGKAPAKRRPARKR